MMKLIYLLASPHQMYQVCRQRDNVLTIKSLTSTTGLSEIDRK